VLRGLGGNDVYTFKPGDGMDVIQDTGGIDQIQLSGVDPANVFLWRGDGRAYATLGATAEHQLFIFYSLTDVIRVDNFFSGNGRIESIRYAGTGQVQPLTADNLTFTGSAGVDHLLGSDDDDNIVGGGGNDRLEGRAGNDRYYFSAGDGFDTIVETGGQADTIVFGQNVAPSAVTYGRGQAADGLDSNDLVISYGGGSRIAILDYYSNVAARVEFARFEANGSEIMLPGARAATRPTTEGADVVAGRDGDDVIDGKGGNDVLFGGAGNDIILGGLGQDLLAGGQGDDRLLGGAGNDTLDGGAGNDYLAGDDGDDFLKGGEDDDELHGGSGRDLLFGGVGDDVLYGDSGIDQLRGGVGDDLIYGGADDDDLDGGSGSDTVFGGAGNDLIAGGAGDDILHGDAGDDVLRGSFGNDQLYGGDGNDTLHGGTGDDVLNGGAGTDIALFNGPQSNYTIVKQDGGNLAVLFVGDGEVDYGLSVLVNVEWMRFGNGGLVSTS